MLRLGLVRTLRRPLLQVCCARFGGPDEVRMVHNSAVSRIDLEAQARAIAEQSKRLLKEVKVGDAALAPQPYFWLGMASLLPLALVRMVHTSAVSRIDLEAQARAVAEQSKRLLKEVKVGDAALAPQPYFWLGMASLLPLALPSATYLLTGYNFLGSVQMAAGSLAVTWLAGTAWGVLSHAPADQISWESAVPIIVPVVLALLSCLLHNFISFALIASGMYLATVQYANLPFPPWFKALRLLVTVPAVIAYLLAFFFRLVS